MRRGFWVRGQACFGSGTVSSWRSLEGRYRSTWGAAERGSLSFEAPSFEIFLEYSAVRNEGMPRQGGRLPQG